MAPAHSSPHQRILLELEGVAIGYLTAMEGDEPFVAEIAETIDADQVVRRHVANVSAKPLRLSFGLGMGQPLYQWMTDWFNRLHPARNGAIVFVDERSNEQRRLQFFAACITRVEIPAMNAAAKAAGEFTVVLQAERVRTSTAGAGTRVPPVGATTAKQWLACNFRLTLQNLQASAVSRIDALVAEQSVVQRDPREPGPVFGPLRVPDLTFWLPEARAADVFTWANDFLIDGKNGQDDERSGSIELLSADLRNTLATVSLAHLGIVRVDRVRPPGRDDGMVLVSAQLYCEEMGFTVGA